MPVALPYAEAALYTGKVSVETEVPSLRRGKKGRAASSTG